MKIIRNNDAKNTFGCDFVVKLPNDRKNGKIKLLQITDMQIIDADQSRTPGRLREDEKLAWASDKLDANFSNHVKSLVTQTKPDMIFITGDMVYGSFDDSGKIFAWFCDFMDSFSVPWACVFGNHDNESYKGVEWQCHMLENTKYGLFKKGSVSGNGNYTVGITLGDELVRVFHMLDSHGCLSDAGIYPDQLHLIEENTNLINKLQNKPIPAFVAMHYPTDEYKEAESFKGYCDTVDGNYTIGVDVCAKDDDFGTKQQFFKPMVTISVPGFLETIKKCNVGAVFAGHYHSINTCITYEGIKWVVGLKTGQYDYHNPGQLGGTLVTLENDSFSVSHVPSFVRYSPFPKESPVFDNFFV